MQELSDGNVNGLYPLAAVKAAHYGAIGANYFLGETWTAAEKRDCGIGTDWEN